MTRRTRWQTLCTLGALAVMVTVLSACAASGVGNGIIVGTLTYADRMAMPAGATASVELVNSATAAVIARTSLAPTGEPPFPFTLNYDPNMIDPTMGHALRARITGADGSTMFVTTSDMPITFDGTPVTITLTRYGGSGGTATPRR